jgi:hypothetical protein
MKWARISWALLFLCVSGYAQNQRNKPSFFITDDFVFQDNKLAKESDQFSNSSSLFVKWANWAGGLTVREFNFYKQSSNWTLPETQYDLYRKYIQYTTPKFEIQAGDFHSMLGRGLVLSVLQNDKIFRNRTIMGGDFRYHSGGWDVRALGGKVEDELKQQNWTVAGGEATREYWKGNRVGVRTSYILDSKTYQQLGDRATWSVSANADKLPAGLSYYVEIGRLNFRDAYIPDGSGYYSNLGWTHRNLTLLFEFKKYTNFDNELNNPPSADRGDLASNLYDSTTTRLYSQYALFGNQVLPFFSIGRAREGIGVGPQYFGGVNATNIREKLDFSFSYGVKDIFYAVKTAEGRILYRFTDRLSAEFYSRDKRYTQRSYQFNEDDYSAQISVAPYGAVFFQKQYSRNLIDHRHNFYSGGIRINVKRDSYFEFSTGAQRGGEVCSGGQCIFLPPFKGWKIGVYAVYRR